MAHPLLDEEEDEALKDTEGITEIIKLDPSRMDGVFSPANGAPFLLIKSIATSTGGAAMTATATETDIEQTEEAATETGTDTAKATEEEPIAKDSDDGAGEEDEGAEGETDDDGGAEADAGAAKATEPAEDPEPEPVAPKPSRSAIKAVRGAYETARREYEAAEPTTKGALDGTDVLKARADWNKWRKAGQEAGLDGTEDGRARWVAKHLAEVSLPHLDGEVIKAEEAVYKRTFTAEQRRDAASAGHALSDGSYPIENEGDLDNAAHLARTGHGNVAGAKRLIARRAKELGVANPLDSKDSDGDSASKAAEPEMATETTPAAEAEALDPETAIRKAMAAGLISQQVADSLLAKVAPLPATTQPAGAHREPDGNTSVEQLEHDAGMHTSPDSTSDHIVAPVAEAGTIPPANANTGIMEITCKAAPYAVTRMHDALCPAFDEADVVDAYPSLAKAMDAVDGTWFTTEAAAKAAAGKAKKAARLGELAKAADSLKTTDPAALADARAILRKAFTGAYPDTKVSPKDRIGPGQFTRGYISAGHAANSPAVTGHQAAAAAPPSAHVPEPQQFERGNLTAGHQRPSPGDHGPNNPSPPGGDDYYTHSEQQMAAAAMRSIHDHIQATFAGTCPIAPTRQAMPSSAGSNMGATNVPTAKVPMSMGGIPTVGKATEDAVEALGMLSRGEVDAFVAALAELAKASSDSDGDGDGKAFGGNQAPPFGKKKKAKKITAGTLKEAAEAGAAAALAAMKDAGQGEAVQALVAGQIQAITERYDSQLTGLTKQVEELGSQPDPAQAPVRGQMSRPGTTNGTAPVERRSLVDEHREQQAVKAAADREAFVDYVRMQATSPDPKVRSRAEELLRTLPAA